MIIIIILTKIRSLNYMKPMFACILSFAPFRVMAHEGPLLSAEHSDYLGLCLIAVGVLLATIASWGPLVTRGNKDDVNTPSESHQTPLAGPAITLVYSRDV